MSVESGERVVEEDAVRVEVESTSDVDLDRKRRY
jgi:hypothetical protein